MADPTFSGAPSPADDKVGLVLQERYRIIRKLGEGGMGSVYEARHELIGKKVAVKTLNPAFAKDPGLVERFRREARAATAAGNAHIIDVTDLGTLPDGSPFLVMEYLEGTEFGDLLAREGALPVGRAVHILSVCDALGAAHGKGIVHRDLKPENIYLIHLQGDPDFVKVLDFGISKMQEAKEGVKSLTQTGTALGTPHYMSPEQAQGLATTDHRADIYALGVILYYALSGTVPFDADSYAALVLKIFQEVPKPLVELRSDIPPELDALVQRCLAKKPEDRFASVQELERALRPFRDLSGKATMVEFAPTDPPPAPGTASPAAAARTMAGSHTDPKAVGPSTGSNTAGNATGITLPETSRRGLYAGVATLAVLVAAGGAWAMLGGNGTAGSAPPSEGPLAAAGPATRKSEVPTKPEVPAATATPGPATTESAAVAKAEPEAAAEVRLQITVEPQDATIFIGDLEFSNPLNTMRPRSLDPVKMRIEAENYEPHEKIITLDMDRSFDLRLDPKPRARPRSPSSKKERKNAKPDQPKGNDGFRDSW